MASLVDAKKILRKATKTAVSKLSDSELEQQSQKATHAVRSLPEYKKARRVSIYLSMPVGEARTDSLVHDALASGKEVFVPYIHKVEKRSIMDLLRLESMDELNGLARDAWGIPSLHVESVVNRPNAMGGEGPFLSGRASGKIDYGEDGSLDLIVMPGVAFDRGMNRLGHGAGFYDSYLARCCGQNVGKKRPFLVGLCLVQQLVDNAEDIPTDATDWPMDALAVGDGSLITSGKE